MALEIVLAFKICCTVAFWSTPLLLCPACCFTWFGMPCPQPMVFVRLLGAAFGALVVGYGFGLYELHQRDAYTDAVRNVVWVGVISNGLACLILVVHGRAGAWESWLPRAKRAMWSSAVLTGAITIGLVWAGLIQRP